MFILPIEIMFHIASFLPADVFIIKFYTAFPEYRNSAYLPLLKNNYNYFKKDFKLAEKLLNYGFRMCISCDYTLLGQLAVSDNVKNIIKLRIYMCPKAIMLRQIIHKFTNLRILSIPNHCIDFNLKKLPKSMEIYKYYDKKGVIDINKYAKIGIKCINGFRQ
jgi:hypothetical protein